MGIYNGHTLQYILLISDKVGISEVKNKLKDNNLNLKIRRCEKTNERYIILTILDTDNNRLLNSEYYKDNFEKWINDFKEYTLKIIKPIDIDLKYDEKIILDSILLVMPEMIESHGWCDENSMSTTYDDCYVKSLEYNIVLNSNCNIENTKKIIKEICNEFNYQVCDFVRCKYDNELQIKLINNIQLHERIINSKWFKKIFTENAVFKKRVSDYIDIELTEIEISILEKLRIILKDDIIYDGWYVENNIYSDSLLYY